MSAKIDVVVPTRNRSHRLARVLLPLLAEPVVRRVIIVNDATDGTEESLRAMCPGLPEEAEVICTGGVGPAIARQAGAERTEAEILLFVDDDVVPDPGLAAHHATYHEGREGMLVCGYTPVVPVAGDSLSAEASVYNSSYEKRCAQYELDNTNVLTHLWGGNFSLRRQQALAVGLSSPDFVQSWHEDRDFGLRCLEAGLTAVFDRGIRAGHEYERAWGEVAKESYCRGYSLVVLHSLHAAVIGSFDVHYFEVGRSRPLRLFIRMSAARSVHGAAIRIARAMRSVPDRLGLGRLQLLAVRMLRLIQNSSGARAALKAPAESPPRP
jgi:glycosyltransferase involved in cell wall biosynthesis